MSLNPTLGIILVDHGSKRAASNRLLEDLAARFQAASAFDVVEPAHMELAEPTLTTAFDRCVQRGAARVVVFPYFLGPGRHWDEDIPRLAAEAAVQHPNVEYLITAPFGMDDLMLQLIDKRIQHCLVHATGNGSDCEYCSGTSKCTLHVNN